MSAITTAMTITTIRTIRTITTITITTITITTITTTTTTTTTTTLNGVATTRATIMKNSYSNNRSQNNNKTIIPIEIHQQQ